MGSEVWCVVCGVYGVCGGVHVGVRVGGEEGE